MVIGRKLISEAAKYVSFLGELWRKYIGEASCSWRPCFSLYTLPHLIPLPISTPTLPKPSSVSFLLSSDQSSSFSVSKFSKIWTKENVLKSQWMPEVVEFSRNKCLGWGFVFLWDIRGKNGDGEGLNTRIDPSWSGGPISWTQSGVVNMAAAVRCLGRGKARGFLGLRGK